MKKRIRYFSYLLSILYFLGALWLGTELFKETALNTHATENLRIWMGIIPLNYLTILLMLIGIATISLLITSGNTGETLIIQQMQDAQDKQKLQQNLDQMDEFKKLEHEVLRHADHVLLDVKLNDFQRCESLVNYVCAQLKAGQGILYKAKHDQIRSLQMVVGYALSLPDSATLEFEFGEGLVGQAAKEQKIINVHGIQAHHAPIVSGLGRSIPSHLLICPIVRDHITIGVWEIGSFTPFNQDHERLMKEVAFKISDTLDRLQP